MIRRLSHATPGEAPAVKAGSGAAERARTLAPPAPTNLAWRVFFTCWLVYTVFWTPYIVREHFPALTLLERGTLNVEPYLDWTEDIFRGPNGGAFINNNPGASLAGAIPLMLLRPALVALDRWNQSQ